jgi:hypothetical protein
MTLQERGRVSGVCRYVLLMRVLMKTPHLDFTSDATLVSLCTDLSELLGIRSALNSSVWCARGRLVGAGARD